MKFALVIFLMVAASYIKLAFAQNSATDIKRGEYLVLAANCIGCHTTDKAKPFAGAYPITTQFGTIYGSNITPDKETGIGTWSDDDFVRAMHDGIGKDGRHLFPAFPYSAYSKLSRDDVLAIKTYLFSLPPIRNKTPNNKLSFPFNLGVTLAAWKLFNFTSTRWQPDASKSSEYNRGMYLTEGLANCQGCHTPRNLTMGLDYQKAFSGSTIAGWRAFNITPDKQSGIGNWKDDDLLRYFKTGSVPNMATASGPMADVVEHSLQYLTEPDLRAIITYLRGVPPIHNAANSKPRFIWGIASQENIALRGLAPITIGTSTLNGAELYSGNCASCHAADGSGVNGYFPALFQNTTTGARDPSNLLMVILNGVQRHNKSINEDVFMPGYADKLSNAEIALLSNFIVQQFGNLTIPPITEEQVNHQRNKSNYGSDRIGSSIVSFFQNLWRKIT
jgi:mono/diheme cytochrome c family protein